MGPEESMQIQSNLGSDVCMAFDECIENPAPGTMSRPAWTGLTAGSSAARRRTAA